MKTLTALLLWVLSTFGGPGPVCDIVYSDQPEMCAPPPPEQEEPPVNVDNERHVANQNGNRISNGF